MADSGKALPLSGVKVVELGTHVAVPGTSRVMAEFGADVIKVEDVKGEGWRVFGKNFFSMPATDDENVIFTAANTNKKLLAVDLKKPEGMAILKKLMSEADIFMTNVRIEPMKKMGIDYDSVKNTYPRLIYAHFTGYGYFGPDAKRPGFDMAAFAARSGALVDWAAEGSFPSKPVSGFGDYVTSNILLGGILMALYAREKTDKGTFLSTSLYGSGIWHNQCGVLSAQEPYNAVFPKHQDEPSSPSSHFYECSDGEWIDITILTYDASREKLFRILGMEEYLDDPRFINIAEAKKNIREIVGLLRKHFKTKTRDEWARLLEEADLVYEKMVHFRDISKDPQAKANNYLEEVHYASGANVQMPRYPMLYTEYDSKPIKPSGGIGADSVAVLGDLGYSKEQIAQLEKDGVIRCAK